MRRLQKAIGLVALVGLASLPADTRSVRPTRSHVTEAAFDNPRTYFDNFPENIPGASHVDKYWTEGASHVLVHFRNFHYFNLYKPDPKSEPDVKAVQDDLYFILSFLIEEKQLKELYVEGHAINEARKAAELTKKLDERCRQVIAHSREVEKKLDGAKREKRLDDKEVAGLERTYALVLKIEKATKEIYERNRAYATELPGIRLHLEGKIQLRGAEKPEPYRAGKEALKMGFIDWKAMEFRELALLERVLEDRTIVAHTTYGGGHAWGGKQSCGENYGHGRVMIVDTLAEWNKAFPNHKFALIEVLPKSYPKK